MNISTSPILESPVTAETTLQREQHLFNELSRRLANALINRVLTCGPNKPCSECSISYSCFF